MTRLALRPGSAPSDSGAAGGAVSTGVGDASAGAASCAAVPCVASNSAAATPNPLCLLMELLL
ncbi:MAG TPA: hypothetical protein VJM11_04755, partial [Nevskiaceae bacterium]|nr:hypothetical protein [Nevskiaceae bacterium]